MCGGGGDYQLQFVYLCVLKLLLGEPWLYQRSLQHLDMTSIVTIFEVSLGVEATHVHVHVHQ
jgi:hypothetical protein